jgi:MoaA/NifB/PqqE/SkfB family radical SAM enzyme
VIQEGASLQHIELPRSIQLEPVGSRSMSRHLSPVAIRVDGQRNAPPAFLSFDAFRRLLDDLPDLEALRLQGAGEPLAHPRFFDMVSYAARRGVHVSTSSRLQAFNLRRAEECVRSGLRHLHIPLDAAGTREYDFSRAGARHERLLRHLRFLTQARAAARSLWPQISFTAVVMRRNLAGLADVVKLAHEHGVDAVSLIHLQDFIDATGIAPGQRRMLKFIDSASLAQADTALAERHFAQAQAAAAELNIGLQLPRLAGKDADKAAESRCRWPWHGAYIGFSGEAKPCGMAARARGVSFGNMLKAGVIPIWRSDAYREFREQHISPRPPELCRSCPRR